MHGERKMEIRKRKSEDSPSGGAWGWKAGQGYLQRHRGIWKHRDPIPDVLCVG